MRFYIPKDESLIDKPKPKKTRVSTFDAQPKRRWNRRSDGPLLSDEDKRTLPPEDQRRARSRRSHRLRRMDPTERERERKPGAPGRDRAKTPRDCAITFTVTAPERSRIDDAAKTAGVTRATWVRRAALDATGKPTRPV